MGLKSAVAGHADCWRDCYSGVLYAGFQGSIWLFSFVCAGFFHDMGTRKVEGKGWSVEIHLLVKQIWSFVECQL